MKIGDYEIRSVIAGYLKLDGGAVFGVVPKTLWSRTNPADETNRIEMCTRLLLLDSEKRRILIDTGPGYKLSKKLNEIYAIDYAQGTIESELEKYNLIKEDITDVILTHFHFDHSGGSTFYDEEKKLQATFPNAVHYVQEKHLDWARNPSERDKASFFPNDFEPLVQKKLLKTVEGEYNLDDYITLIPVNGHTRFMNMVKISDDKETLLFTADLVPMESHLPLPFITGYDLFPLVTLEEKRKYLTEAVENNWILFLEHDPYAECLKPGLEKERFFTKEKFKL
ncbi:MAG: MBL fold metallo-hydrolase [Ignavibacteria bacterium]|nr:MBL fold metallo-hydrolase [Ignavibacteria bacterium]